MQTAQMLDLSFLDGPAWDASAAIALEAEADGLVTTSGISGADPVIAAAAGRCVEAHYRHDHAGVVEACRQIRERVEELRPGEVEHG